jgi:hypothetical protein
MLIFKRQIEEKIRRNLFKGKIILILGPRQTGKTTLSKTLLSDYADDGAYYNCEILETRASFIVGNPDKLKKYIGSKKIVVFDEAQTIENIGAILKTFIDTYPDVQVIATGSSSFDLANKINEPLTGRSFEYTLLPLSLAEIRDSGCKIEPENILRFGLYPGVMAENDILTKEAVLRNLTTNYLYKDIFIFESIKNPVDFENLLKILAMQIGSVVSVNELSQTLGISRQKVDKYLRLLEQSFVIKRVNSFSRNPRTEIKKGFKIFFLDVGIRNAILGNISSVSERSDKGGVFENFIFTELLKRGNKEIFPPHILFWRTRKGLEVDFILEKGLDIEAYECKWKEEEVSFKFFLKKYPEAKTGIINYRSIFE